MIILWQDLRSCLFWPNQDVDFNRTFNKPVQNIGPGSADVSVWCVFEHITDSSPMFTKRLDVEYIR